MINLRKMMMASVVSAPLLFSGCTTTGGGLTQEQVALLIQQIQAKTVALCAFQPTAISVATLIAAFYSPATFVVGIVDFIGDTICKSPVAKTAIRRGAVVSTRIVQTPKGPVAVSGASFAR